MEPYFVVSLDHITLHPNGYICFLGNVSDEIIKAANNMDLPSSKDILQKVYGSKWKSKLAPSMVSIGFGFNESEDYYNDNEIEDAVASVPKLVQSKYRPVSEVSMFPTDGSVVYSKIGIYPTDSIYDLKCKIFAVTGVNIHRQYITYNEAHIYKNAYTLKVDNMIVDVSPENMHYSSAYASELFNINDYDDYEVDLDIGANLQTRYINILSCNCDKLLESKCKNIKVKVHDYELKVGSTRIYSFIDLYNVLPISGDIDEYFEDSYKFSTLYYGFIVKYWPMITPHLFKQMYSSDMSYQNDYPFFYRNIVDISYEILTRDSLVGSIKHNIYTNKKDTQDTNNIYITNATLYVDLKDSIIRIEQLINLLHVTPKIPVIVANLSINNGVRVEKVHPIIKDIKNVDNFISQPVYRNSLIAGLYTDQFKTFIAQGTGKLKLSASWTEDTATSFAETKKLMYNEIIPIIETIQKFKYQIFPIPIKNIEQDDCSLINVVAYSLVKISGDTFAGFKKVLIKYEDIGMVNIKNGPPVPGKVSFVLRYGAKNSPILKMEKNANNEYAWLTDDSLLKSIDGRVVHVTHRSMSVKIDIEDTESIDEFILLKNVVIAMLNEVKIISKQKSKNKLNALKEVDPVLFNYKSTGNSKLYSIECQSKKQPEFSLTATNKATKYKNFTTGEDIYFYCTHPNYSTMSFRHDIHPKGICVPCCKKSQSKKDSATEIINKNCLTSYKSDDVEMSVQHRHILNYGKVIPPGRLGKLPPEINNLLLRKDMLMYGVQQTTASLDDAGYMYSICSAIALSNNKSSVEGIITSIIDHVKNMDFGSFIKFSKGFDDQKDLALAIQDSFLTNDNPFNKFSKQNGINWRSIIERIVHDLYNVAIMHITEKSIVIGSGSTIIPIYESENGIYPIVLTRIVNVNAPVECIAFVFDRQHITFKDIIIAYEKQHSELKLNLDYLEKIPQYCKIVELYVNKLNIIYGAKISFRSAELHIAITKSTTLKNYKANYMPMPVNDSEILYNFFKKLPNIKFTNYEYIIYKNNCIGFSMQGLNYYHTPIAITQEHENFRKDILYDPILLDKELYTFNKNVPFDTKKITAKYMSYRTFLAEFSSIIREDKHIEKRNEIKKIKHIDEISKIKDINYRDIQSIKYLLEDPKYIERVDNFIFDFDSQILPRLRKLEMADRISEMKKMMKDRIVFSDSKVPENIIISCYTYPQGLHCSNGKLSIQNDMYNKYIEILAQYIENPFNDSNVKLAYSQIINPFKFEDYKNEYINVQYL
jgi:hypothetical protein